MFFLTLYLQHVRDMTPVQTGLMFLAFAIPFATTSSLAGTIAGKIGARAATFAGLTCATAGSLIFATVATDGPLALVGLGFAAFAVGGALAYNGAATSGMSSVPPAKAGTASGIQNTLLQLGAAFGLAIASALFKAVETDRTTTLLRRAGASVTSRDQAEIRGLLSGSDAAQARLRSLAPAAADQVDRIVNGAFMDGFHAAMVLCLCVGLVAIAAVFLSGRRPAPAPEQQQPSGQASPAR